MSMCRSVFVIVRERVVFMPVWVHRVTLVRWITAVSVTHLVSQVTQQHERHLMFSDRDSNTQCTFIVGHKLFSSSCLFWSHLAFSLVIVWCMIYFLFFLHFIVGLTHSSSDNLLLIKYNILFCFVGSVIMVTLTTALHALQYLLYSKL